MTDELTQSQQRLGEAIERARMGEDRDLARLVREVGERFVRQLFGLLRMVKLHALDNEAFDKPLADVSASLTELMNLLGAVHLVAVEDQVYVNDIRIRFDERGEWGFAFEHELRRHEVGGLSFQAEPGENGFRALVAAFAAPPAPGSPRRALQEALVESGVDMIDLLPPFRFRITGEKSGYRAADLKVASTRASSLVDATFTALGGGRMPNPLPIRRVVTEILESDIEGATLVDPLPNTSPHGAHTVRVTLLAMLVGREIGLSKEALQDLGVAAMMHDVGYAAREGATDTEEGFAPPFERHSAAGARLLLRQRGFHAAKVARVLSTLEHHRDNDDLRGRPSLFARIIRVAEDYDTMVRPGGGRMSPDKAIRQIAAGAGTRYDPAIAQLLINVLGRYPPGTILQLEDGRIVRVVSLVRSPETFDRPLCRLLRDAAGNPVDDPVEIDLAREGKVRYALS